MMDDHTSPTLYERYFLDGQFANWRMSTKYANLNPKTHFLVAMMLLFGSLAIMLALAPLGMCYLAPLASWSSACDFGGGLTVTLGKMRLSQDNCDTVYNKKDWQEAPTISYPGAMKGRRYTVFVLDPDVPDYPNGSYYLHMLQTNVMGEDLKEGNLMRSLTLASYVPPAPPEGSGLHRYMFVIYQHCRSLDNVVSPDVSSRLKFDLAEWFKSLKIKMLGPKVGVQFRAGF
ncbi:phosphatidylethanolamine-binding protein 1 isoform X1 [Halyomorpha halys]|uniref:phosphatidylethanolamine-binding protein 1 isoform X1 n=1 Tax=Halyomorpha halys TaxID=286706 RepID=UPI0006D4F963|nr:phosphatidylethanolamine-binding protein 1-like [Halyomorpha halys]